MPAINLDISVVRVLDGRIVVFDEVTADESD